MVDRIFNLMEGLGRSALWVLRALPEPESSLVNRKYSIFRIIFPMPLIEISFSQTYISIAEDAKPRKLELHPNHNLKKLGESFVVTPHPFGVGGARLCTLFTYIRICKKFINLFEVRDIYSIDEKIFALRVIQI